MLPSLDPILIKGGSMPSRLVCLVLRHKLPDIYIVEKRVKNSGKAPPPPPFRAIPERKHFLSEMLPNVDSHLNRADPRAEKECEYIQIKMVEI